MAQGLGWLVADTRAGLEVCRVSRAQSDWLFAQLKDPEVQQLLARDAAAGSVVEERCVARKGARRQVCLFLRIMLTPTPTGLCPLQGDGRGRRRRPWPEPSWSAAVGGGPGGGGRGAEVRARRGMRPRMEVVQSTAPFAHSTRSPRLAGTTGARGRGTVGGRGRGRPGASGW